MKAEPSLSIFISIDALSSLLFRFVPNRFFSVRARRDRVLLPPSSASANWSSVALLGAFVVSFFFFLHFFLGPERQFEARHAFLP